MKTYTIWIDKGDTLNRKGGVFMRVHLPENGGMTMIENTFIDQFMPSSSGDFVKIYLYLLRCAQSGQTDVSIAKIADALHFTESDVERAMGYWQKMKCLDLVEDAPVEEPEVPAPTGSKITEFRPAPKYSKDDLRRLIFLAENYLNRTLSLQEQEMLAYFITDLGMDIDLVDYLLDYCVSKHHTSFHYIRKVAVNWAEQGISSVEEAKKEGSSFSSEYFAIFREFGISGHVPTTGEKEYMDRWLDEYELPMDVILLACRRTILQTGKSSFPYADSILRKWSSFEVASVSDVEKLDKVHEFSAAKDQSAPARAAAQGRKGTPSAGRFLNFEPSGTDWEKAFDSLMKAQDAKKAGETQEILSQES